MGHVTPQPVALAGALLYAAPVDRGSGPPRTSSADNRRVWLVLGGCGLLAIITIIIAIVVASNPSSDSDVGGAISTMADSTGDLDCSVYDAGSEERGACLSLQAGFDADTLGPTFVTAYRVCSIIPPAEFPKQGFGHSKDPFDAAHAYAAEMFEYAYQGVAEEGCLAGFDDQS